MKAFPHSKEKELNSAAITSEFNNSSKILYQT